MLKTVIKCLYQLSSRQKYLYISVVTISSINAIFEVIGLASILPVISMLANKDMHLDVKYLKYTYDFFHFENRHDFIFSITIFSLCFIWLSVFFSIITHFLNQNFIRGITSNFAKHYLSLNLNLGYEEFHSKSSSEFLRDINGMSARVANGVIGSSINIISKGFQILFISICLLTVNFYVTSCVILILFITYLFFFIFIKKYLINMTKLNFHFEKLINQILLGCYKTYHNIHIDNQLNFFVNKFYNLKLEMASRGAKIEIIGTLPRRSIELLGFTSIVFISYRFSIIENSSSSSFSYLAFLGICSYKLLPSAQQLYNSFNRLIAAISIYNQYIIHYTFSQEPVYTNIKEKFNFDNQILIRLENVSYSINKESVFNNINYDLMLPKFLKVDGPSGSGKSTFIELILGLRKPTTGKVYINQTQLNDNNLKYWWDKTSYVPQDGHIFQGTILENIVVNSKLESDEYEKILDICGISSITDNSMCDSLDYTAIEGGINLSGGQRSRILIARAIYKKPKILIIDETLSSLDKNAAKDIINNIFNGYPDIHIIIINHRDDEFYNDPYIIDISKK